MGNWDNAFIKSIIFVGIASIIYLLATAIINGYEPHEFMLVLALYGTGYIFVSFVGWMLVGLPTHYLLSKYTSASFLNYMAVVVSLTGVFWLFPNAGAALFFGLFSGSQALIFRYYVYKKHNKRFNGTNKA
ncbi:hypothetical protein J7384_18815 [Endozoicomonas sp. G2_1]|uniref:hypothetical protein n=1 Tax=Endozoicomonas sp. G2_1 TaxID=2821091 RepID=UPI001ADA87DC|nr:hypothetical protein [Endozoicomonas sp. G2_1]MBO9492421.1 hypothetical protein [Endozoicomonas sp. G2_1]